MNGVTTQKTPRDTLLAGTSNIDDGIDKPQMCLDYPGQIAYENSTKVLHTQSEDAHLGRRESNHQATMNACCGDASRTTQSLIRPATDERTTVSAARDLQSHSAESLAFVQGDPAHQPSMDAAVEDDDTCDTHEKAKKLLSLSPPGVGDGENNESAASKCSIDPRPINDDLELDAAPSADLEGALGCLKPEQWVSSTAIELVLSFCPSPKFRILDSLFFQIANPTACNSVKTVVKQDFVLVPLHHQNHWTLAHFDLKHHRINYYDSLAGQLTHTLRKALLVLVTCLKLEEADWSIHAMAGPVQANYVDCGVYLLATAIHLLAEIELPRQHDCNLWRLVLSGLLLGDLHEAPPSDKAAELSLHPLVGKYRHPS